MGSGLDEIIRKYTLVSLWWDNRRSCMDHCRMYMVCHNCWNSCWLTMLQICILSIFGLFGKEVVYGNGAFSFLVNLIWILFFGWGMALGNIVLGCMWCITIVGIPFGKQFFKMARLSFMPFGANVL